MSAPTWERDDVQFPRLLAEISATQDSLDIPALAESMDLSVEEVNELFDRADAAWERQKCDATDADECATARERSVAGVSDTIPSCPVHGPERWDVTERRDIVSEPWGEGLGRHIVAMDVDTDEHAALIASAPAMREALRDINDICRWVEEGNIDFEEAFNQIGKLSTPPNYSTEA